MTCRAIVAIALLVLALPCSVSGEATTSENSLQVYRQPVNSSAAVPSEGGKQEAADARTGDELVDNVRNGYRHIIIRSHIDLNDTSGLQGMDSSAILAPAGNLAILGQCDGAEQAPESSTALLPNQCVLTMSGQARYFIATDGPGHQLFIQNIMILRAHEAGEPRAAISLYQGQIAVYDTTVESRQHAAAPAMVMDSASAFIARSSFVGNSGPVGGAVGVVRSALNVTASIFHSNVADGGAGGVQRGGAVWAQASVASMHDCTFFGNRAAEQGGALFFEGPTLATVTGTNFSGNTAGTFGASVALSAAHGPNTLVLARPSFAPAATAAVDAAPEGLADIYADGESVKSVFVVNPESSVVMMGPDGCTWEAPPTSEMPPLPPAQGYVQPKVLSGREAWISTAQQVLEAAAASAGAPASAVPMATVQPPPPAAEAPRSRPWLFVGGIVLASAAVLGLAGIVFRMCRVRALRGRMKKDRSGNVSAAPPTVVEPDASTQDAEQPPSPPRLWPFTGRAYHLGRAGGGTVGVGGEAYMESGGGVRERGGMRAARLGAWASRFRPATINEEDEDESDALEAAMEPGPEGPGRGIVGGTFGSGSGSGSGSAENIELPEGQGPTLQSDAMLPQITASSEESLPGFAPGRGGAWGSSVLVGSPGASSPAGSTGGTRLGPVDSSATLSLREHLAGPPSQGAPTPLMPQHSASQSVGFSHSLALSRAGGQSSASLPGSRPASARGAHASGFTFARLLSATGLRAPTAALGAPIRDPPDPPPPEQPEAQGDVELRATTSTPHDTS